MTMATVRTPLKGVTISYDLWDELTSSIIPIQFSKLLGKWPLSPNFLAGFKDVLSCKLPTIWTRFVLPTCVGLKTQLVLRNLFDSWLTKKKNERKSFAVQGQFCHTGWTNDPKYLNRIAVQPILRPYRLANFRKNICVHVRQFGTWEYLLFS